MRKIWMLVSLLVPLAGLVPAGSGQMKERAEVGIDERLGARVALDVPLRDESGAEVTLGQFDERPVILIFNYFSCPGICPTMLNNMVSVVNRLEAEPGKDYDIVAVSFDPADTPVLAREKKANYLNRMRRPFPPGAWRFLTGTGENTRKVADSTGYRYLRQGEMFAHPGAIILLTPDGIISRYIYGTSYVPADVEMAIKEAAGGRVRPTISRVLAFCYTYDPEGRTYVLSVTRLAGGLILLLVVVFVVLVLRRSRRGTRSASRGGDSE
ncbi:MAG: SCO family protein [Acidobacteria bacterium]|nr:SCO family protein [Acidobacteriota bacterium]